MSIQQRAMEVLSHVAETKEIFSNPDLPLYDLQILDSLKTVELIVALSEEFGIEISPAEFERSRWATPRNIVHDLETKLEK